MTKHSYLTGVNGWLRLLVLGLTIFGPLIGLGNMTNEFDSAVRQFPQLANNVRWQHYQQIAWVIFSLTIILSISAGYRLWEVHRPESVRFAIITLWLSGPAGNMLYLVTAITIFGWGVGDGMIPGIVASGIIAAIWHLYLVRSIRVKNTYTFF